MQRWFLVGAAGGLLALPGWCQGEAATPTLELSTRTFGGREGVTYYGASLERSGWFLRGVGAKKGASVEAGKATLLRGGSDFEFGGTLPEWHGLTPQLGVSLPDTGSRRQKGAITARLRWAQGMFWVEPQAVLGRDALVGIAIGAAKSLGGFTLSGSLTPIVNGKNGVNETTGAANRKTLWEAGITRGSVTVGATNALGTTTGFGLSPSVGGIAVLVKVKVKL
ncbi:MAG: hypothetical protein QM758_28215 [Armatimonas sp.]